MLNLTFSNRTEGLLKALAKDIAHFRARSAGGAWVPVHLVLPNPAVKQFLFRSLAKVGVLAHTKDSYLEGFWRRFLPSGRDSVRLLDRGTLQGLLLALLQDSGTLGDPELRPVAAYLAGPARELKAFQLAGELARVFEAYLLGRPEWAPAWEANRAIAPKAPAELEGWQRHLWRKLRQHLRDSGETWLTLPELITDARFQRLPFPAEVFIFGLGHVARTHLEAFRRLGEARAVHLYALSPSAEAWEDFKEEWQATLPTDTDPGPDEADPFQLESRGALALRRWGRPVREHVRLLSEVSDWQATWEAESPEGTTLLAALQRDLLQATEEQSHLRGLPPDKSITVHACASIRREAEAMANLIWDRILEGQGAVRFSDIAVLLPESLKADYLEPLRLAFASTREIPWALADEGPALLQEWAEATQLLLRLGLGDLNRAEVLRVMAHPALRRAWSALPLERLAELCERCAIIARLDRAETEGTSLEGGLWTWERGLQRAALGRFAGEAGRLPEGDGTLPGAPLSLEEADLLHLVTALLRDARHLRALKAAPSEWVAALTQVLRAYLAPDPAALEEGAVQALDALLQAVGRLEQFEPEGLPAPTLGLREVSAFLEEALQRLLAETLSGLGGGVVVASHASVRGIPFDTILMMGMGEGVFPGRDATSPLDLRSHRRHPGDLSRSDQDRTLFLESLLSARKRLVFSYVHRDPITEAEREPSALLLDLRDALEPALGAEGWGALQVQHPIHRHDLAGFPELGGDGKLKPNHHPAARTEAEALWLGQSLRAAANRTALPLDLRAWGLGAGAFRALAPRVQDGGPLGETAPEARPELRLRVADLRKWLEDPLQGGALIRLGLRGESDEDPALVEEEPFETPFLVKRALKRNVFWRTVGAPDVHQALEEALWAAREAGLAPVGPLRDGDAGAVKQVVDAWRKMAPDLTGAHCVRFGPERRGLASPLPVTPEEAVRLEVEVAGQPITVLLEGMTEPLLDGETLLLSEYDPPKEGKPPETKDRRELLRPWLDQLLLAASGLKEDAHAVRVLGVKKSSGAWRVRLPALDRDAARAQLRAWLEAALADRRWHSLPLEGVLECLEPGEEPSPDALEEWLETTSEKQTPSFSALYGPLPRAAYDGPDPDWVTIARTRLGAYLDWSRTWEEVR